MNRTKRRKTLNVEYEERTLSGALIQSERLLEDWDKKDLKTRAAYFLLNGVPVFSVNMQEDGKYKLLAADKDFYAAKSMGVTEFSVRVYKFTEKNFSFSFLIEVLSK